MNGKTTIPIPPQVMALRPVQASRLRDLAHAAASRTDGVLAELVRLRIATLLGHPRAGIRSPHVDAEDLPDGKIDALPRYPTSELFDERERDCLAFAEQFVMDVANMTDEDAAAVSRHFDDSEFYAFVASVYIADYGQRLEMASAQLLSDPTP